MFPDASGTYLSIADAASLTWGGGAFAFALVANFNAISKRFAVFGSTGFGASTTGVDLASLPNLNVSIDTTPSAAAEAGYPRVRVIVVRRSTTSLELRDNGVSTTAQLGAAVSVGGGPFYVGRVARRSPRSSPSKGHSRTTIWPASRHT